MVRRGFSLLETVIYVAILALSVVALSSIFTASLQTQSLVDAQHRLLDAQRATELAVQSRLSEARTVTTPVSGSASTLVISSPTAGQDPVTFALSGTTLTMKLGAAAAAPITPPDVRVTAFTATRLSGSPASVHITIVYAVRTAKATLTATSVFTITLRYD